MVHQTESSDDQTFAQGVFKIAVDRQRLEENPPRFFEPPQLQLDPPERTESVSFNASLADFSGDRSRMPLVTRRRVEAPFKMVEIAQ